MISFPITQQTLARFLALALFSTVVAGTWDVWWHAALGRDSFWEPPHVFLYASITVSILTGVYGWYVFREAVWKRMGLALSAILLSAPVDEFWHRTFGLEDASSALIIWSPPHLILVFTIAASFLMLLPILRRDEDVIMRFLLLIMSLAGALSLLLFPAIPVEPIGLHQLLGFWGAGIISAIVAAVLVFGQLYVRAPMTAFGITVFFLLLNAVAAVGDSSAISGIPEHGHIPFWLNIFSLLAGAALLDVFRNYAWRGALFGLVSGSILYGFGAGFMEEQFAYSPQEALIGIVASVIGASVGILLTRLFQRNK